MKRKRENIDDIKTQSVYWIVPTKLRNYMLNDTLVDWLEEHHFEKKFLNKTQTHTFENRVDTSFNKFIIEKGVDFENNLVKYIDSLFTEKGLSVVTISNTITSESLQRTINLMNEGVHIICSAPVRNAKNNTHGIIDLLVRSDYLDKLVDECPMTKKEIKTTSYSYKNGKYIPRPYHYVVVDIKFSTLPLRADGKHLLNSGSYPAYKAQCLIYTQAVGLIQKYTSNYAFILGRRWKYTQNDIKHNNYTCLNKLGIINYKRVDEPYIQKTKDAIKWVLENRKNGKKWSVSPPSRLELYPNMSIDSGKWQAEKEKIASDIGEISSVWYCGWQNRNLAISKGIKSWKDERCTSKNIGIKGVRAGIIDSILDINRQTEDKIRPKKVENNLFDWKTVQNEIFVDFETLSDIFSPFDDLPNQKQTDMIFMIGAYYRDVSEEWKYISFIAKNAVIEEEYRIMSEFYSFIKEQKNPKLWYWYADDSFWKKSTKKLRETELVYKDCHKIREISEWTNLNWADMCDIFKTEPIVIKGCFKFGLKAIASAMKEHNLVNTEMESVCNSGMNAMIGAYKFYNGNKDDSAIINIINDIEKYNKFDCTVLYDIITYLRRNHC